MAWLEDLGKTIGQVAQGVTDAAQTVTGAAQETMDQIRQQREQEQEDARKCLGCGQPLNGVEAVCPMCGYELRGSGSDGSIGEFARQLGKIERGRNNTLDAISKTFSGRTANPTDEKIASHIRNYIIPNTKEDVFEFMLLASSNLDAKSVAKLQKRKGLFGASNAYQQEREGISEVVLTAWLNKFDQAYQKAKISFGGDSDFRKIQDLYDSKMNEIEAAKSRSRMW